MAAIDRAAKLRADLQKYLKVNVKQEFERKITQNDLMNIADKIIDRMLQQIGSGISPIANKGRFPEYKSRSTAKALNAQAREYAKDARDRLTTKKDKTAARAIAKSLRRKAAEAKKKGYPDSLSRKVKQETGKKARPVNLKLYGDFLEHLTAKVRSRIIEIGYFDQKSSLKELGHREGANGQAKRPTIPVGKEKFNAAIEAQMLRAIDEVLKRRL